MTSQHEPQVSHPQHLLNSNGDGEKSNDATAGGGEKVRGKYLAIDYGTARVGLAVGDSEIKIAFALTTLENNARLFENLQKIIVEQEITQIVLGKLGTVGAQTAAFDAEIVGKKLTAALGMPVVFQEEMFSTKMAEAALKERGAKNIKSLDNQEAARVILQSFLDK